MPRRYGFYYPSVEMTLRSNRDVLLVKYNSVRPNDRVTNTIWPSSFRRRTFVTTVTITRPPPRNRLRRQRRRFLLVTKPREKRISTLCVTRTGLKGLKPSSLSFRKKILSKMDVKTHLSVWLLGTLKSLLCKILTLISTPTENKNTQTNNSVLLNVSQA